MTAENQYERCDNCNQILQTTEEGRCEDCTARMAVSQTPEARADRGGMAYALYSKGASFAQILAHAQLLGLDADLFEEAYMRHGGIIFFDPETDAAPAVDPRDAEIAALKARIAQLEFDITPVADAWSAVDILGGSDFNTAPILTEEQTAALRNLALAVEDMLFPETKASRAQSS